MPRKKNASLKGSQLASTRRSTRQSASRQREDEDEVPDVFRDMLVEAYNNSPDDFAPDPRPAKRRKVTNNLVERSENSKHLEAVNSPSSPQRVIPSATPSPIPTPVRAPQVIISNDFSDEDDDSDVSFEDVNISRQGTPNSDDEGSSRQVKSLQINLSASTDVKQGKQPMRAKIKPLTKAERHHRLNVHKWHFLCLLLHMQTVNRWCDDESVQKTLKRLVTRKVINQLHIPETRTQAERKFSFDNAISEICLMWRLTFKVIARGVRKAQWQHSIDMEAELENATDPVDLEDFRLAAHEHAGSRDLGAQLFCALLRSLAVETRLVCSLQLLPFSRSTNINSTPEKAHPASIVAGTQDFGTNTPGSHLKKTKIIDSPYPIWWVEVFSPAITAWIPLDPLVRNTINKPRTGFEPPASDAFNSMSYVIAFEDDGTAKDVTRRYASQYNAKTRRTRVEVTKGGTEWLSSVMQHFTRPAAEQEARDVIEDAALNRRVMQEGMPKNVQDFKDHPIYVLERHLRANEVIEPKRECGKFSVGAGKNMRLESVYRRENVHLCRSSEGWYRRGRDIQPGSQPLKRANARKRRNTSLQPDDEDDANESEGIPLYAEFQTDLYVPPPVVNGQIPRNGYGNLDVYVASMIPAGAVHIRHPLAGQAAKTLKINAVDAVTGFVFKGRQGTAVVDGVVVDAQYTAAVLSVIEASEDQLEEDACAQRGAILLSVWKKMHAVLKVRQRLQEEYGERTGIDLGTGGNTDADDNDNDPTYDDTDGGGFLPDVQGEATRESRAEEAEHLKVLRDRAPIVLPSTVTKQKAVVVRSPHKLPQIHATSQQSEHDDLFGDDAEPGGFVIGNSADGAGPGGFAQEDRDPAGGFMVGDSADEAEPGGFVIENSANDGHVQGEPEAGGFIHESGDQAGGFLPEEIKSDGFVVDTKADSTAPRTILARRQSPPIVATPDEHIARSTQTQPPTKSCASIPSSQDSTRRKKSQTHKQAVKDDSPEHSDDDNSIPSHDPDEDDLEPDWVQDAFE